MSNLLEKASIVTTPTAYDNGKILSVKPAPSLSSELVTNGGFDTDSGWTKQTSWSISGGAANYDFLSDAKYIRQTLLSGGFVAGKVYKINFDITSGTAYMNVSSNGGGLISLNTYSVGSYSIQVTASASGSDLLIYGRNTSGTAFSIDNVSVKQEIDGDFDFTRNSSATRVNSQGLIEDMQILSSNLVSNGDFSQEGSELITNGDFSNGSTDWANPDNAATFSNDSVTLSGGSGNRRILQSNVTSPTSSQWKLQYEIIEKVGTSDLRTYTTSGYSIIPSTVGIHTYYFNSNLTSFYFAFSNSTGSITIDNVSVKEVGQDWNLGTGWSIGNNKAIANNVPNLQRLQRAGNNPSVIGNTYKYSINISNVSGFYSVYIFGVYVLATSNTEGIIEGEFTATSTNGAFWVAGASASGLISATIENITILEITDDTNLPRIDYTGGVGHWLFEPQSTNKIIYSEDFTQWNKSSAITITSNAITSPSGALNATLLSTTTTNRFIYLSASSTANSTFSIYVKWKNGSGDIDLSVDGASNYTSVSVTSEWTRVSITPSSSITQVVLRIPTASELYVWGAQVEAQTFATSYIPTNGEVNGVTRLQDAAFGAGSSDLINSTEGVLYAEIAAFISTDATEPNRYLTLTNGTSNQRIALLFGGNNNQLRAIAYSNTQSINLSFSTSLTDTKQFNKLAIKYKSGDYAFFLNGIKIGGSTEANIFTADTLNDLSFNVGGGTQKFRGKVKCVAVFKEALTDAELTCLTTI